MLIEKAWAKVAGSYEQGEKGHVEDVFQFLAGGPQITYPIADYRVDINRGPIHAKERVDKLWKIINEANQKGWIVTATTPVMPEEAELGDEESNRWVTIDGKGIKYAHTYTMIDARVVNLPSGWTDIIILLRNPSQKSNRGPMWTGDWASSCDLWTKKTKK